MLLLALVAFSLCIGGIMSSAMHSIMITSTHEITSHFLQHEVASHLQGKYMPGQMPEGGQAALAREIAALDLGPSVTITDIEIWEKVKKRPV